MFQHSEVSDFTVLSAPTACGSCALLAVIIAPLVHYRTVSYGRNQDETCLLLGTLSELDKRRIRVPHADSWLFREVKQLNARHGDSSAKQPSSGCTGVRVNAGGVNQVTGDRHGTIANLI